MNHGIICIPRHQDQEAEAGERHANQRRKMKLIPLWLIAKLLKFYRRKYIVKKKREKFLLNLSFSLTSLPFWQEKINLLGSEGNHLAGFAAFYQLVRFPSQPTWGTWLSSSWRSVVEFSATGDRGLVEVVGVALRSHDIVFAGWRPFCEAGILHIFKFYQLWGEFNVTICQLFRFKKFH